MAGFMGTIRRSLETAGLAYFDCDGECDQPWCTETATGRINIEVRNKHYGTTIYADGCDQHIEALISQRSKGATKSDFEITKTGVYKLTDNGKEFLRDEKGNSIPIRISL